MQEILGTSLSNYVIQWSKVSICPRPRWLSQSEGHLLKQTGAYIRDTALL
jgi:hypothetical protein